MFDYGKKNSQEFESRWCSMVPLYKKIYLNLCQKPFLCRDLICSDHTLRSQIAGWSHGSQSDVAAIRNNPGKGPMELF